jgi:hypothetical protein
MLTAILAIIIINKRIACITNNTLTRMKSAIKPRNELAKRTLPITTRTVENLSILPAKNI